ncbi:MAG: NAD(P)-dependent oxidoreductase [Verrucomicrobiota bacterium]
MKTLLVTGASGFLGWNICAAACETWRVVGVARAHPIAIPGVSVVACDLTRSADVAALYQNVRPDAVIHAAATAQPEACQRDPQASRRINVDAVINIAGLCADAGIPCVFTSTDLVFDGTRPPYRETDSVSPVSVYGEQKVAAEQGILARHPDALVCRMPLMFGDPGPVAASFLRGWLAGLTCDRDLPLFVDETRTPVSGRTAAAGLLMALGRATGTLHLGGRSRISRYAFGILLAELLGVSQARIQPVRQADIPALAPRPPDVSLDSSKAYALGYDPPPLRRDLEQVLAGLAGC